MILDLFLTEHFFTHRTSPPRIMPPQKGPPKSLTNSDKPRAYRRRNTVDDHSCYKILRFVVILPLSLSTFIFR